MRLNVSVIKLFRGDLSRDYLTFSKFVAFIGRINIETFSVIPSFAKDIRVTVSYPENFLYLLHHRIQFGFREFQDKEKFNIFMAINAIALCLVNYKRLRNRNTFKNCKELIDSKISRPFYSDLIRNNGFKVINDFELEFKTKIDMFLPKIEFVFKNQN